MGECAAATLRENINRTQEMALRFQLEFGVSHLVTFRTDQADAFSQESVHRSRAVSPTMFLIFIF